MSKHRILTCAFTVLLAMQTVKGVTYYVSPHGADSNPGTQSFPWRTVQRAADISVAGDTIRVTAGVYAETVKTKNPGLAAARITFDGNGQAKLTRFLLNQPYITVKGFTLSGDPSSGTAAITLEHGAHHAEVSNNFIDTQQVRGIDGIQIVAEVFTDTVRTNSARHCLIVSNHVENILGATAIQAAGWFNTIQLNTVSNIYSADFVRLFGVTNTIQNNRFLNNIPREGVGYHADFIQTFGELQMASLGHIIEGNIISNIVNGQLCQLTMVNSFNAGMHGGWIFRNNIFVDISLQASVGIPNVQWLNNLFLRCNQSGHVLAFGYTQDRGNSEGAVVLNNMFIDCGPPTLDNLGWYTYGTITNLVADFNMVSKNGFQPVRQEFPPSAFRWYEPNGINGGDPMFLSPLSFDFRLRPGSPLRDKGKNLADVPTDFSGVPRPQYGATDIGPFEFIEGLVPATPSGLRLLKVN